MKRTCFPKRRNLYLVLSEEYGSGRPLMHIARSAISGGVDILQMREKHKLHDELFRIGTELRDLCRRNDVLFIVNDDPSLAEELDADGVHMGQEDIMSCSIDDVRLIIGQDRVLGLSTHSLEQFRHANESDADYLAFGPVFPTQTKDYHIGTDHIKEVLATASKPVVLIGGINTTNLDTILNQGADNVALIRDIMQAQDIEARTRWYKNRLMEL